ncbi:hypothetical protein SADUNF_Sadunf02G0102700 [Salix dunnii]|uniref:Uncharacterized protein n=1 Tax=Salix dunnii TaxID=1413687 RepID=A0A835TGP1_9ROSI|nr:hypothetical protein SADUNF_Sadunf02G0102700 [Salix dunnii]
MGNNKSCFCNEGNYKTMIEDLLTLQESKPESYKDETIKDLMLVQVAFECGNISTQIQILKKGRPWLLFWQTGRLTLTNFNCVISLRSQFTGPCPKDPIDMASLSCYKSDPVESLLSYPLQ